MRRRTQASCCWGVCRVLQGVEEKQVSTNWSLLQKQDSGAFPGMLRKFTVTFFEHDEEGIICIFNIDPG